MNELQALSLKISEIKKSNSKKIPITLREQILETIEASKIKVNHHLSMSKDYACEIVYR
ncbi:MAG: hypothetical protein HQK49_10820 [Oligoflexia bacterium]|nr:hypothetical protein [Oligoflexia bacterium]